MYKFFQNSIKTGSTSIPVDPANIDYQRFIRDVAEQGIQIVEGPDVVEPSYRELRLAAYPPLAEQQDMQYWDSVNGTTVWADTITAIKEQYPKTITGSVTIGPVPAWVQEAADNWLFNKQLSDYVTALERLGRYVLLEGRPELTGEVVIGREPVLNADGLPTFDEEGNQLFTDITETVITQTAIDPLPEWVEAPDPDSDPLTPVMIQVRNPEIVQDEAERAAAQAVVDATPQAVKDAVANAGSGQ